MPTANSNIGRLLESVKSLNPDIIFLKEADFSKIPKTKWKMFLYDNEYLSDELLEALLSYLENKHSWDFMKIYKKDKKQAFSISPRLFRSYVQICSDCIMPLNIYLSNETILDGFIYD